MPKELSKETIERMFVKSERDWTEDFEHENGKYQNNCIECKQSFMGHKRRVVCKKCSTPDWIKLSKRQPPEDTKDNKAWNGAWLEGEMVGYAKCMVDKFLPLQSEALRSLNEIEKLKEENEKQAVYINKIIDVINTATILQQQVALRAIKALCEECLKETK